MLYTSLSSILEKKTSPIRCCHFFTVRLSWCRSRHSWRWESRVMSSPRRSSRDLSPNSVLWKDSFLFCNLTLFLHVLTHAAAAAACRGSRLSPATWKQRFPDARLKIHLRFKRCSNLVSHTRDIPRWAVKIRNTDYQSFLLFRVMMNRNP